MCKISDHANLAVYLPFKDSGKAEQSHYRLRQYRKVTKTLCQGLKKVSKRHLDQPVSILANTRILGNR